MPTSTLPAARSRRTSTTGNNQTIEAAAAGLPKLFLPDDVAVCAILADGPRGRYERAAVRWLSGSRIEPRPVLAELQQAIEAPHPLPLQSDPTLTASREAAGPARPPAQ